MSLEENKVIIRRIFEEGVNKRNLAVMDELLIANYVHHDPALPPEMQGSREAYKQMVSVFVTAFPDLVITIEDVIAEGDKAVCRWAWRGTHQAELMGIPPTGKQVTSSAISIYRIAGGKIAEAWVNFDALGMMQQLGVVPPPG